MQMAIRRRVPIVPEAIFCSTAVQCLKKGYSIQAYFCWLKIVCLKTN